MQQNDNNWLDAVRDSIESIEEPLPEGMWDSVAADMAAITRRRKAVRLSIVGIAAAAVLAGAFLILPQQGKPEAAAPLIAQAETPATAADQVQAHESGHEQSVSQTDTGLPEMTGQPAPAVTSDRLAELSEPAPAVQPETEPEPQTEQQTRAETPAEKVLKTAQERKADQPADRQKELQTEPQLELQPEHIPEHHSRSISTGINFALGNGSSSASAGRISTASVPAEEPIFATRAEAGRQGEHIGYHTQYVHNMPVNVGINLSIGLSDILSLETGLTYSYHSARHFSYLNDYVMGCDRQEIHFAGLPLGLRLTAVEMRKTSVYLYAGVMTQKCLYASWNGNHLLINPVILSSELSAGFQYDIAGPMSVYIEPGLIHCSVSGDETYTMYNDAPWNFNLKGGIRFNIK
ncbi:MAG: hypothetical protein MJY60_05660 [Bacteroidales bacterium]|nr:hypothetical protein [Bacteroidales bacterium]